jgi:Protein of unknown function (DUF3014)
MDNFDEQPLERAQPNAPPVPAPRKSSFAPVLVVAALGLVVGGGAAWWWTRSDSAAAPPVATNSTEAVIADAKEPAPTLPPLGQMDTFLRALLGTLSAHPDFARWLATDDLIRQAANGIDRISRGQSPAADLQVLRPAGDFAVTRRRNLTTIDPAGYQRYDRLASLVDSLEARGVVEAYRTIQPRLDEAYRALGRTSGSVDDAVQIALQLLIETPVPDQPVALAPGRGATYAYRDPELERLMPIQKQLLRMGPDNMQRVQMRLRDIRAELTKSDKRTR